MGGKAGRSRPPIAAPIPAFATGPDVAGLPSAGPLLGAWAGAGPIAIGARHPINPDNPDATLPTSGETRPYGAPPPVDPVTLGAAVVKDQAAARVTYGDVLVNAAIADFGARWDAASGTLKPATPALPPGGRAIGGGKLRGGKTKPKPSAKVKAGLIAPPIEVDPAALALTAPETLPNAFTPAPPGAAPSVGKEIGIGLIVTVLGAILVAVFLGKKG